jgi:hypothetical protein
MAAKGAKKGQLHEEGPVARGRASCTKKGQLHEEGREEDSKNLVFLCELRVYIANILSAPQTSVYCGTSVYCTNFLSTSRTSRQLREHRG